MNPVQAFGKRVLLAAGTKTYRHGADFADPLATLDQVPISLRQVVEALSGLGYKPVPSGARSYLLNPALRRLKALVQEATRQAPVLVIYYTGHGLKPEHSPYYLATTEAQPGRLDDTAMEARQLLRLVLRHDAYGNVLPDDEQPQVLIILDCCFSGSGGVEALKESLQDVGNPKVWVLASAGSVEWAQQGRFATALKQALQDSDVGSAQEFLGLDWLAEEINATLGNAGQRARYFPPGGESTGLAPFFPNPKYDPSVAGLTVAEQHWVSRLRGAPPGSAAAGFYVTGRTGRLRVVKDLAGWMRDPGRGRLAVMTGSPGCGKSAMLALPVLLTDLHSRQILLAEADHGSLVSRAAGLFDGLHVLGMHVRGLNPYQAADAVAKRLGRSADNPHDLLADLDDRPETSPRILVIDAVDEAREPSRLLTDLLLPLASRPGLGVVIGARRHVLAGVGEADLTIDLDTEKYLDPQALADYAHQLLVAAREPDVVSPYRDRDETAVTVAEGIAEKATARPTATGQAESFLLAQLLARAVRGRHQVLDVTRDGWSDQLPAGVGAAFGEDLRCLLGERAPAARALLAALAWARGPGLPWERVWVSVAQMLAARAGTDAPPLDRDDVRWLLDNVGTYIVEDIGPGQRSVFRLLHDVLAAFLRGQPSDEQIAADPAVGDAWQQRRHHVEADITRALLEGVPATSDGKADWELAHPYLRTYLAQHAAAATPAAFSALVQDLDFLTAADPLTLSPLLSPTDPELGDIARIYLRARPLFNEDLQANAAYIREAASALGSVAAQGTGIRPLYRTHMASVRRDDSLLTLTTGQQFQVKSVAFGTRPDGRLLLAVSSGTRVQVWDPVTGEPAGNPLDNEHYRHSVAFGTSAERRLLLAAAHTVSWDMDEPTYEMVRVWDPVTGEIVADREFPPGLAVLGTGPDGRLVLARSTDPGEVWMSDPVTGAVVGEALAVDAPRSRLEAFGTGPDGHVLVAFATDHGVRVLDMDSGEKATLNYIGSARSVALSTSPDGRMLLAVGGFLHASDVSVWDNVDINPLPKMLVGHTQPVNTVAFGATADGHLLLASGSDDHTVRVWDPSTAGTGEPPVGQASCLQPTEGRSVLDGRLLQAAGSDGQTIRVWERNPDQHADRDPLQWGFDDTVVFGTAADGRLLAAGTDGRSGWVWDPVTGERVTGPLTCDDHGGRPVAFGVNPENGHLLLAIGSFGAKAQVCDPLTSGPVGEPLTGQMGMVSSLAFGTSPDGRLLLAIGYNNASYMDTYPTEVRVWDALTSEPAGDPLTGHNDIVLSVAFGTGPDGRLLLASGSTDATVRLWNPLTSEPVGEPLIGHKGWVGPVAFSVNPENGRLLLVSGGGDHTVRLWNPMTRECHGVLQRRSIVKSITAAGCTLGITDEEGVSIIELEGRLRL